MDEQQGPVEAYLTDMDGVLVREEHPVPGARELLAELTARSVPFLVLTNNSMYTPRDLRARLLRVGLDVPETGIWTSRARVHRHQPRRHRPVPGGLAAGDRLGGRAHHPGHRPRALVGKPNPLMMRSALRAIGAHSQTALMIGDRMDTDIVAGPEAGMRTVLVLTGSSTRASVGRYPYRPDTVLDSVADLVGRSDDPFGAAPP